MHRAAPLRPRPLWRYLWVLTLIALGMSWLTLVFVAYFTGLHEAGEVTGRARVAVDEDDGFGSLVWTRLVGPYPVVPDRNG